MEMPNNSFREIIAFIHKTRYPTGICYILPLELQENNNVLYG
jgi:hypothetical protein